MIMWQCMMEGIPWHLYWENSVVQCSHLICARPPTSCLLSLKQMTAQMGLAGGLHTVKHLVGVNGFSMSVSDRIAILF